jgi:hypothetical protein
MNFVFMKMHGFHIIPKQHKREHSRLYSDNGSILRFPIEDVYVNDWREGEVQWDFDIMQNNTTIDFQSNQRQQLDNTFIFLYCINGIFM